MVQWLGLGAFTAGSLVGELRSLPASRFGQKKKKKRKEKKLFFKSILGSVEHREV